MKQTRLQKFIAQHRPKRKPMPKFEFDGYVYRTATELAMAKALIELGLVFTSHYKFCADRKWEADFWLSYTKQLTEHPWPGYQDILIEIQGGIHKRMGHSTGRGIQRDIEKFRDATMAGYRLLPFSSNEVMDGRAKAFLEKRLLLRGAE